MSNIDRKDIDDEEVLLPPPVRAKDVSFFEDLREFFVNRETAEYRQNKLREFHVYSVYGEDSNVKLFKKLIKKIVT